MKTFKTIIPLIMLMNIVVSACGFAASANESPLEGSSWVLRSYNQSTVLEGSEPTLTFTGGSVSGNGGCNSFEGNYHSNGDEINIGPIVQTERACWEPEGRMEQERIYLEILGRARSYQLANEALRIISDQGETLDFVSLDSSHAVSPIPLHGPVPSHQRPRTISKASPLILLKAFRVIRIQSWVLWAS